MALLAVASAFWLVLRTGTKPSRITYPCQKAAVANVHVSLLALFAPLIGSKRFQAAVPHALNTRFAKTGLLLGSLLLAFGAISSTGNYIPAGGGYRAVPLKLEERKAATLGPSSDLFFIENASGFEGSMEEAVSALLQLMEFHGLQLFKTSSRPEGLIGKDDVVIIKVNCQWTQRGGTNTDLVKSLIQTIVNHPEGFIGEIVVADNGQGRGSLDWGSSNAFNHSQSMQDVVDMFPSYKVSTWLWDTITTETVNEYDQGDLNDGYVVNFTANPNTYLYVSYPKFKTDYGTYISFKKGVWNPASGYNSEKLKVINVPVLKSHTVYGVTASVKNYMGVVSQDLTFAHYAVAAGGMGTEMVETRVPILNILDSIWVNANPKESGNPGPATSYEAASFTNVIGASQDPVALEYWASKHILIPAAIHKGYTEYSSLDPDYEPITPGLDESYHNYLERSMNELKNAGYQATMNSAEMNVYVSPARANHDVAVVSVEPSVTQLSGGESIYVYVTVRNEGTLSDIFNATESFNVTAYARSLFVGGTTEIKTQTVLNLVPENNVTLLFAWTTPLTSDTYELSATAEALPGEVDMSDNTYVDGIVIVTIGASERNFLKRHLLIDVPILAMGDAPNPVLPPKIYNTSVLGGIQWLSQTFPRRSELQSGNWTLRLYYTASQNTTIEVTASVHDANTTTLASVQKFVELAASDSPTPYDIIFTDPSSNGTNEEWLLLSNRRLGVTLNSTETYAAIYYDSVETASNLNLPTLFLLVGDLTGPIPGVPDNKVDMRDIASVARLFGAVYSDPTYDPIRDLTGQYQNVPDGKIDIRDIALVASHFGESG